MSLRLPEALSAWLEDYAQAAGKTPHRIVVEAVELAARVAEHRSVVEAGEAVRLAARLAELAAAQETSAP